MNRWMTGAAVVAAWGGLNTLLAVLLAGFTAAGLDGGAGHGGVLAFAVYAAASGLIFTIALLVWAGQRRAGGLRLPAHPAAAALLAVGAALIWLGLPFGVWAPLLAAFPLLAALLLELSGRR